MTTQLVIGAGEVGTALAKVLGCDLRDIGPHEGDYDLLHVTFPWFDGAEGAVRDYLKQHSAERVVIHSTFPVEVFQRNPLWLCSPVRGRHPHLEDGIRTFVKHVGGVDAEKVARVLEARGLRVAIHPSAEELALAKLIELSQLAVEVAMEKEIHRLCVQYGVDRDSVYVKFGRTYNEGYEALGETRFHKPILDRVPGPLGGHCVRENSPLLRSPWFQERVAEVDYQVAAGVWE